MNEPKNESNNELNHQTELSANSPILLDPANFTSLTRTPWAGETIFEKYKNAILSSLGIEQGQTKIGESWEVSCDPSHPSRALDSTLTLQQLIEQDPEGFLSPEIARQMPAPTCEILVKLLNAATPLSVQIHPSDDDPDLGSLECGKPESWLVLDHEPGTGLYLGFNQPLSADQLRSILMEGEDLSRYLNFTEVKKGDYFEIPPGVVHAIGPGVTLLEPQRIIYGKSGKTFRLWDWNRRYGPSGELDTENGEPRELHIDESLKLIDYHAKTGVEYIDELRRTPETLSNEHFEMQLFPPNPYYQVANLSVRPSSELMIRPKCGFITMTILEGHGSLVDKAKNKLQLKAGQSVFVPFKALACALQTDADTQLDLALTFPAQARITKDDFIQ